MKKVILHIGTHKTGTSSLQQFIRTHYHQLRYFGVFGVFNGVVPHNLGALKGFTDHAGNTEEHAWDKFHAAFADDAFHTAIISTETFSNRYGNQKIESLKALKEELQSYDVQVLVYLRRQDTWLESFYQQYVKMGIAHQISGPSKLLDLHDLDYFTMLRKWEDVFGKKNLIVKAYTQKVRTNLLPDFFETLSIPLEEELYQKAERQNEKVSYQRACVCYYFGEWIRKSHRQEGNQRSQEKILWLINQVPLINEDRGEKYSLVDPKLKAEVITSFADSNQRLSNYLSEEELNYFQEQIDYPVYRPPGLEGISLQNLWAILNHLKEGFHLKRWPELLERMNREAMEKKA